jgi:hypothetical protein
MTLTGLAIGIVWVARDEYVNPKWTGIPKASQMDITDLSDWNKQFGPTDAAQWALPASENQRILDSLAYAKFQDSEEPERQKKSTW